jgi:hypothetical protein
MKGQFFNTNNIHSVDFIQGRQGQYRAIVKVKAGFMTVVDDLGIQANWGRQQWNSPMDVFKNFKKGALQTIEFKAEGSNSWLTVFARTGNKVKLMDVEMFMTMKVGDINQDWYNTNLYSQTNYALAGAKSWADLAFALNQTEVVAA